jgi:hypothetical protein
MAYQVNFAWQIPEGTRVKFLADDGWHYGTTPSWEAREKYLNSWVHAPEKGYAICVAEWDSDPGELNWLRLDNTWVEGNTCGSCGSDDAPADDYLCEECRLTLTA